MNFGPDGQGLGCQHFRLPSFVLELQVSRSTWSDCLDTIASKHSLFFEAIGYRMTLLLDFLLNG